MRKKPLLVWDGDCRVCRTWIERWRAKSRDRVAYEPYQTAAQRFPQIPIEAFRQSVQLILPDGSSMSGALAVFTLFSLIDEKSRLLWMYKRVPWFGWLSEICYRFVASHRSFFARFFKGDTTRDY